MSEPKRQRMSSGTELVCGEPVPVTYLEHDEDDDGAVYDTLPPYHVVWEALTPKAQQEVIQYLRDVLPPQ